MRSFKRLTLVRGDDWEGLYLDGKLIWQGHTLESDVLLDLLQIENNTIWANLDWLHEQGGLPEELAEVRPQ